MKEREYTLQEIVRDPGVWVYEAYELTREDHYYLFRYDASQEKFYRATVPAGAAAIHFHPLQASDKVPIGGWIAAERAQASGFRLHLVDTRKPPSE
ncbi:hypothetical protein [Syntrophobacter fumaroxidans]|uniref:Uncharacterized protein n=1 Tax=Syntrophobacter fumaroxidans (strain DSM 10017 / MPOB) TaxID=335543 RepID=A0LL66_SYNFM|nr:hypothetical protein [Syntrophobacter fumaroxidans]ABK18168.1 hypothetical protein Sfum_2489 [Syntrophobacter fumaroxidans MPOB]